MAGVVIDDERARPSAGAPVDRASRSGAPPWAAPPGARAVAVERTPGLRYRPALDGLRAVAVLAVMAEHGGVTAPGSDRPLVPGGFLGVDVFLVISGFLITSLLLLERRRTGGVDLRAFWVRRARRLLPAVGVMVPVTCALVVAARLPMDRAALRGDALASLGYVANWRFVLSDQSYFASFGLPSPFRHLWSLSLEEQWYLVFPPLLVGVTALARRRTGALLAVLLAAAAASAAWTAVLTAPGRDPSRAYYGTDTRAQTLLVGAALAVVMVRLPGFTRSFARVLPPLGAAGLVALGVLFATVPGERAALYDGGFLVVALAAAAVVAAVALPGAAGPAQRLLAHRPLVAIGRRSYGLYLWYWPVYVWLTPDRVGVDGAALAAVRLSVTFAVAGASYAAIEQPVRRHGLRGAARQLRRAGLPGVRPAGVAAALAGTVVALVVVTTSGPSAPAAVPLGATPSTTVPVTSEPVTTTVVPAGRPLPAVPADRPLRVMVGGDSVAWSLVLPWVTGGAEAPAHLDLRLVADLGCTVTPGVVLVDGVEQQAATCRNWREVWSATAFDQQPDVAVVMWGAWEVYDHRDGDTVLRAGTAPFAAAYQRALASSIDEMVAVAPNARIALVTVPCMDEVDPRLGGPASPRNDPAALRWINERTAEVARRYGGRALVVDLGPLVCPGGRPVGAVDGVVARADGVHFTPDFAPVAWGYVEQRLVPWLRAPATATG